jgi:ADP-heptose:LPS heptosyltransferase
MRIKQELFIDRFLIRWIILIINILARVLGFIFRIDHNLDKPFRHIAVCKFKGMGSIIQATPLLKSLRSKYPDAEIIFVSTKSNKSILREINIINTTILLDDDSIASLLLSFPNFISKLIARKIDIYFDLEIYSGFSSLVTTLSMATNRIGYYLRSSNYRMGIYTHMMFFNLRMPIYQVYLQMGRFLQIGETDESLWQFNIPEESISIEKLDNYDLTKEKYIVINPNASDLRIERRWPLDNFVRLISELCAEITDHKIFLIGSKGESDYVAKIYSQVSQCGNVYDLSGKTSFTQLIVLLKHANLFITNDSGHMHLAFSLKTRTISLFGPCLPSQYGVQQRVTAFYKNIYCSPCVHEFITPPCKGNNVCMKLITPGEVLEGTREVLASVNLPDQLPVESVVYFDLPSDPKLPLGIVNR